MTEIELLQQIGLNKYEAEAYYTLVAEGALTGYELGKRSQVPLSRSYEILERLTQKGLALIQPGEPPRYIAERPERFLGQMRTAMNTMLDTLASSLTALAQQDIASEFWVIRGRQPILARMQAMIAEAQTSIDLSAAADVTTALTDLIAAARARGCTVHVIYSDQETNGQEMLLLQVDASKALAGVLVPGEHSQAVISSNRALVTALNAYFTRQPLVEMPSLAASASPHHEDWLAWEERKLRKLWKLTTNSRVA